MSDHYPHRFGNIATAVAAVKAGAFDYLPNRQTLMRLSTLLQTEGGCLPPEDPMSADRVRWEHIQRVFEQCDRNVSETALPENAPPDLQRILQTRPAPVNRQLE